MPGLRLQMAAFVASDRGRSWLFCGVRSVLAVRQNVPHPLGRTEGVEQVEKAGTDKNVEEVQKDEFRRGDQASEKR